MFGTFFPTNDIVYDFKLLIKYCSAKLSNYMFAKYYY
jgi:hypothetical protein